MLVSIAPGIALDLRELEESFMRASGPGGQNVNKVSTAVQLRLDLRRPGSVPEHVRERAERLGGHRVTDGGVLVVTAQRFRSQDRNRRDAVDRVVELLRAAAALPVLRRATKPGKATKRRRMEDKAQRGALKRLRAAPARDA